MSLSNSEVLYNISMQKERKIIGLMSGTSMDGLDVALCTLKNSGPDTKVKLEQFRTVPYDDNTKQKIREVFAKNQVHLQTLCNLNAWIGKLHGTMVNKCLGDWGLKTTECHLIASHGQTVFHSPKSLYCNPEYPNSTLQIGDGDQLAVTTGIITVSDFRQKHVAAGGDGAPLALYGDYFVFSKQGENRIMLNIGGIANITCLYGDMDAKRAFATDLGPGNTLIDAMMRHFFQKDYDRDGRSAKEGIVNPHLLKSLKLHKFFAHPFPKTTGPELLNLKYIESAQVSSSTTNISYNNVIATLTRFSAEVIAEGILKIERFHDFKIYASGGGVHNPVLMSHLRQLLPGIEIKSTDVLGISGDSKEAVLFAILANETICDGHTDFGNRIEIPSVCMGKISFPR